MHPRWLRFSLAVVLSSGPALLAQTPAQPPSRPAAPTTTQPGDMMLTGCLRGSAAAIGTSPGQGMIYTLEVVEAPVAKPSTSTTATGAVRTDVATTTTYTLSAPESVGLAKHVDHEVQLTGSMQPPAAKPAAAGGAGTSSAAPAGKPGGAHRTVQVAALKMISTNCPKK